MNRIAIFPGSFDPFTRGHAAIVDMALELFDRVVVAVGCNSEKKGLLTLESRMELLSDLYGDNDRVEVSSYQGLTIDFAREVGAVAIIRGVRNTIDFEYEKSLAAINDRLNNSVTTVMLFAPSSLADVSSSVVRELLAYAHSVDEFMPEGIKINKYIK